MDRFLSIDIEATGLDISRDRIVSLGIAKPGHTILYQCNPGIPIPEQSTAIHGITNAMSASWSTFASIANIVLIDLEGYDLVGFNLLAFDIPLLWEEFNRAGIFWDLSKVAIIDVGTIFKKQQPRTLEAAVDFYCNEKHEGAHNAASDARATLKVLLAQMRREDVAKLTVPELAAYSRYSDLPHIDIAGKLVRDADGDAVYNFSRVKGTKVKDDIGFARWMMDKDFPENVKHHLRIELAKICPPKPEDDDFDDWEDEDTEEDWS